MKKGMFTVALSVLLLVGCATGSGTSGGTYSPPEPAGIKALISQQQGGFYCCAEVFKKVRVGGDSKSILILEKRRPGSKYSDYLHIQEENISELINYLVIQLEYEGESSKQKMMSLGNGRWRTGTQLVNGEHVTFFITLKNDFAFTKEELAKLIALLKEVKLSL